MKPFILLYLLSAILNTGAGQSTDGRNISLNGVWHFALAHNASEAENLSRFYESSFDSKEFHSIPVPSNWALHGFEEPMYGRLRSAGQGFYLHRFHAPESLSGKRVLLRFGGVWDSAEVWLNGQRLGRHDSGFTSFAFDVTKQLKPGAQNELAVRVRQITRDYLFDTNDDWSLGGIYRDVWLESMPADRYIDRVETYTTFDSQFRDADLHVRVMVQEPETGTVARRPYILHAILAEQDGKEVQRTTLTVPGHPKSGRDTLLTMHIRSPRQWTAETPNLYRVRVELESEGHVTHEWTHGVGFREVSAAGGILKINGRPVKLRGVCRHDEYPDVGIATRREDWLKDLRLMKAANINMVRTVHYPPAAGFLDLCDEMGMYVIDEVPMGYGGDLLVDHSYASAALLRAEETIARDRNHPSVIIWSIGNENPFTALHLEVIRMVKGEDPTRPTLMPWNAENWLPPEVDILAPHYYSAAELDALAASSWRPVLTTEYIHALGKDGFGGLENSWSVLMRHPNGAGGSIWMWQDQGLKRTHHTPTGDETYIELNPNGIDGIVNAERTPQRDYWETKAVYAPVAIPIQKMVIQSQQTMVRIHVCNNFDFTNLDAIGIHWQLMADDRELASGKAHVSALPHTTGSFELPLTAIREIDPGVAYYAHISFLRGDGSAITTRSVEFLTGASSPIPPAAHRPAQLRRSKFLAVTSNDNRYEFDPRTARLVAATRGGHRLITGSHLTLWRPLNDMEQGIYRHSGKDSTNIPDLDHYTTTVRNWKVSNQHGAVRIDAEGENRINEQNSFDAEYHYLIQPDGSLEVTYSIRPRLQVAWVPEVGMELDTAPELTHLRWLGLGPLDAYPNERMAAVFGLWSGGVGSETVQGVKAGIRWAELMNGIQFGVRVENCPYLRVEAGHMRVLSAVVGRPEKYRRPPEPEYRLDITSSTVLAGSFTLSLVPVRAQTVGRDPR